MPERFTVSDKMGRGFDIVLLYYGFEWKPENRDIRIEFKANGLDYSGKYTYEWHSTSASGLASLYSSNGSVLYDPYRKNNPPEGVAMVEIGRLVYQYVKDKKPLNTLKQMKTRTLIILMITISLIATIVGCAGSRDGCKATRGMSGYNSR